MTKYANHNAINTSPQTAQILTIFCSAWRLRSFFVNDAVSIRVRINPASPRNNGDGQPIAYMS